jgi:hypothetical protein
MYGQATAAPGRARDGTRQEGRPRISGFAERGLQDSDQFSRWCDALIFDIADGSLPHQPARAMAQVGRLKLTNAELAHRCGEPQGVSGRKVYAFHGGQEGDPEAPAADQDAGRKRRKLALLDELARLEAEDD